MLVTEKVAARIGTVLKHGASGVPKQTPTHAMSLLSKFNDNPWAISEE
jgi:hypothetical protein